jgi:hypothetical protein
MKKASKDEARKLLSVPFALTRSVRAPEAGLRRVRVGECDGRQAWTFDLSINLKYDSDGDSTANNYSGAVVQVPARVDGRIALARKGFLRRAEQAGAPEVQAGTEDLRDKFTIRATSPETAEHVLDERVCEWLTGPGSGFHYEIANDRVLAYGWRRWLGGDGPLKAATGLAEQLSQA